MHEESGVEGEDNPSGRCRWAGPLCLGGLLSSHGVGPGFPVYATGLETPALQRQLGTWLRRAGRVSGPLPAQRRYSKTWGGTLQISYHERLAIGKFLYNELKISINPRKNAYIHINP